jgi:hypothetical protein
MTFDRKAGFSGSVRDFYSGGAWFESAKNIGHSDWGVSWFSTAFAGKYRDSSTIIMVTIAD